MASAIPQASLADAPPVSAISTATNWVSDLLFGPLATAIAVIAIAWMGMAMLSGRIDIRRGLSVIFGCFLLLGAKNIAIELQVSSLTEKQRPTASIEPIFVNTKGPPPAARCQIGAQHC
jgi:type IV secretion system protein VirB2